MPLHQGLGAQQAKLSRVSLGVGNVPMADHSVADIRALGIAEGLGPQALGDSDRECCLRVFDDREGQRMLHETVGLSCPCVVVGEVRLSKSLCPLLAVAPAGLFSGAAEDLDQTLPADRICDRLELGKQRLRVGEFEGVLEGLLRIGLELVLRRGGRGCQR